MKRHAWIFALSMLLAFPAAAQVMRGFASTGLSLRAGPDIGYPALDFIPAGTRLYVHGCIFDWSWCDVSVYGERGWVAGDFIDYPYDNRWVSVYDYGAVIGFPILRFVIGDYWYDHYRGRPFYGDRDYWYHHRFAYHDVPRYRHDRRRLAYGVRGDDRYDRYDRYDRHARYDRGDDRHDRRHDRGDRHARNDRHGRDMPRERVASPRFGARVDIRHGGDRYDQPRRRLAPSVRQEAMPHGHRNQGLAQHAPQRSFGGSAYARSGGGQHALARSARPSQARGQSRGHGQKQHGGQHRGNRHDRRDRHDGH